VMMSIGLELVSSVVWTFTSHKEFAKFVIIIFYITNFSLSISFLRLAQSWPQLMLQWHHVEQELSSITKEQDKRMMKRKIQKVAVTLLSLAVTEHIFYSISGMLAVSDCHNIQSSAEAYFVSNFPQVFFFLNYSHVLGAYAKFIQLTSTFVWVFADFFVIMVSIGLTSLLKLINDQLMLDKGKVRKFATRKVAESLKCSIFSHKANVSRLLERASLLLPQRV
jgi:Trehalose receptor